MTTIAVTGHMDLTDASVPMVREALRETLKPYADGSLTGISCIAKGADSLFAEVALELGGRLVAVIPSQDYRQNKVKPDHAETFDRLIEAADEVLVLSHQTANRSAYEDANRTLLQRADRLVAVWNGEPPTGKGGGTADTVIEAREAGLPVDVVWPDGASRRG
ncbi:SLOG family protein [Streptomyces ipomoeae]|uniref:SLOG family protein n=1 Tax=Streptomyces ipomoeae TaxID=103232 RepID=UPI0029AFFB44|nr:SLOG family protein [Streptomyces ipomoeae]MDX2820601.1 SLOG family protein [Streptomyces ipomoeae]MDX2873080.1 SLOG family protein [Streptomyces ipomoeae]